MMKMVQKSAKICKKAQPLYVETLTTKKANANQSTSSSLYDFFFCFYLPL